MRFKIHLTKWIWLDPSSFGGVHYNWVDHKNLRSLILRRVEKHLSRLGDFCKYDEWVKILGENAVGEMVSEASSLNHLQYKKLQYIYADLLD